MSMHLDPARPDSGAPAGLSDRHLRLQKWILRIMALVALPVVPAIFAPHLTVEKLSWLLGFGQPPKTPLLFYLGAGGSCIYLIFSAMLWIISSDVVRYRPLVVFTAWVCVICGPLYVWIDTQTEMPRWWWLMDSLSCFLGGVALLWAIGKAARVR